MDNWPYFIFLVVILAALVLAVADIITLVEQTVATVVALFGLGAYYRITRP